MQEALKLLSLAPSLRLLGLSAPGYVDKPRVESYLVLHSKIFDLRSRACVREYFFLSEHREAAYFLWVLFVTSIKLHLCLCLHSHHIG